jgi:anti-sigma B factor antagonist
MPVDDDGRPTVLTVATQRRAMDAIVALEGELDLDGAPILLTEVRQQLMSGAEVIEIDAAALSFIDSAGLHAILSARAAAQAAGRRFRVGAASTHVVRIVELTGLSDTLCLS